MQLGSPSVQLTDHRSDIGEIGRLTTDRWSASLLTERRISGREYTRRREDRSMTEANNWKFLLAACIASVGLGAVLLMPSGAHVLEMKSKLSLDRDSYFTVQQIYLGWALFGPVIVAKILLDAAICLAARRRNPSTSIGGFISAGCIGLGLAAFFVWVQPSNSVTENWTVKPASWIALRQSWEYGHLAIAVLTIAAFGGSILALTATALGARSVRN